MTAAANHAVSEVALADRFAFGANWERFLRTVDESRIREGERSLTAMLGTADLAGKSFVDVGSGSGLFSLAARRLGATVHSFDFDPQSVACAAELKRRYFPDDGGWTIARASVLDEHYLASLGRFDVVYSWGVLHHTGAMWKALENVVGLVDERGKLFIAIYNDQGWISRYWRWVKRTYVTRRYTRWPLLLLHTAYPLLPVWFARTLRGETSQGRGMALWRDLVDWVGGYPFEVAKPEEIFRFYRDRGFTLEELRTTRRLGCNEFVFVRAPRC
jgi:2-polyprenyl-6-hydroxyphenyl methylase/3-demethylubiquinone-9 3-methyltransferase